MTPNPPYRYRDWLDRVVRDVNAPATAPPAHVEPADTRPDGLSYIDADDKTARMRNDINDLTGRVAALEQQVADLRAETRSSR